MVRSTEQRAVITGCGVISPLGHSVAEFWRGLVAGNSALRPIAGFETAGLTVACAAEVVDFDARRWLSNSETQHLERIDQFALSAARQALDASQLDLERVDKTRVGIILATSLGAMQVGEDCLRAQRHDADFAVRRLFDHPYYALATGLARRLRVSGPVLSPSIACASGTHAVGMALDTIRAGHADVLIVGGAEVLCQFVVAGFNALRATTADTVRPFDLRRSGLQLGEGAALLIVESLAHAQQRGVRAEIEVLGSGLSSDATHMTAPARDGAGATRAMRMALKEAAVEPHQLGFISAHGTGTVYNDAMEIAAITAVLGDCSARIPVNSIKGSIGHCLAAAGAFEAVMCTEVLQRNLIPPTANCEQLDAACNLDIVRGSARTGQVDLLLSTSSAFAGNNAAIVIGRIGS